MATKTKTKAKTKAKTQQTTLTEDLREILATLNKFRRKHRLIHIQVNSVDTGWLEEHDDSNVPVPEKCPQMGCLSCHVDCPHETGERDDEDCYCDCTCNDCDCKCDDCAYCDLCRGLKAREEVTGFQSYWNLHTGSAELYKKIEPILVTMNQMDADNIWSGSGEFPKDVCTIIGDDIADEIVEQQSYIEDCIADRIEAETNEAKTRAAIDRLSLLHVASEKTAEELGREQGDISDPSVERFKRLDLD